MSIYHLISGNGHPVYSLQVKSLGLSQETSLSNFSDNTIVSSPQFPIVNATGTNVLTLSMASTGVSTNSLYINYRVTAVTGSAVQLRSGALTMSSICVTGTAIASASVSLGTSTVTTTGTLGAPVITNVSSGNTSILKLNFTSSLTNPEMLCDLVVTSQNTPEINSITFP
jgi:hypothetical protein